MTAPAVGTAAPDFTLRSHKKEDVTLSSFRDQSVVVVAFYPAAFTGVCTKEMCRFRDSLADFNDLSATVLGVSVDSPFSNGAFAEKNDVNFSLLSDHTRSTVNAYGIAIENFAGMDGYTAAQRSVFVVGKDGNVAWSWVADNPGQEPDYDAVAAAVKAAG
jgi:peroxiredoxin